MKRVGDKFTAVVFDIGGVLLEWKPIEIVASFTDDPDLQSLIKQEVFEHPDWLAMDNGDLSEEIAIERIHQRSGIRKSELGRLMTHINESLVPLEDFVALVEELRVNGVNLYCLSNMPAWRFDYLHSKYPFWSSFKDFVISGAINMMKPDRDIFEYLLNQFHLRPDATIFIDDHEPNVDTARAMGFETILFRGALDCRSRIFSVVD